MTHVAKSAIRFESEMAVSAMGIAVFVYVTGCDDEEPIMTLRFPFSAITKQLEIELIEEGFDEMDADDWRVVASNLSDVSEGIINRVKHFEAV